MARLIMRRGPHLGAVYELEKPIITIGRGAKNEIVVQDNEVSREHCRLTRVTDDYELEDLDSNNGTYLNGQPVKKTLLLKTGSMVQLGDTIVFEYLRDTSKLTTEEARVTMMTPAVPKISTGNTFALVVRTGPDMGRIYTLTDPIITIGRNLTNTIVIQDTEVSRLHMKLYRGFAGYAVEDLSTNGTYINGVRAQGQVLLRENDVIHLGSQVELQYFRYQQDDEFHPGDDTTTKTTEEMFELTNTVAETELVPPGELSARIVAPGTWEGHVFLNYAREEWQEIVVALTLALQDAGLKVWSDQHHLVQGSTLWRREVQQALSECPWMVLVVSPRSMSSAKVQKMYEYFVEARKPIVLLVYEPVGGMPTQLGRARSVSYDAADPKKSFQRVIFELRQLRGKS